MPIWKVCPNCGGHIPDTWKRHEKCGWNVTSEKPAVNVANTDMSIAKTEMLQDMHAAINDAFAIWKGYRQENPEMQSQLDLTKIALTLFIQRRREEKPSHPRLG